MFENDDVLNTTQIILSILATMGAYGTILLVIFAVAPEPQKLIKGKWVKMPEPDYWLHYLEWVSMVHGIL
jgi:hypothetical protein